MPTKKSSRARLTQSPRWTQRPLSVPPPTPAQSRIRAGPHATRPPSPLREFVTLHVRKIDKDRFDRIRALLVSDDGRIPPLWEVFGVLVDVAELDLGIEP